MRAVMIDRSLLAVFLCSASVSGFFLDRQWQPCQADLDVLDAASDLTKWTAQIPSLIQCLAWATQENGALVCHKGILCTWWDHAGVAVGNARPDGSHEDCFMYNPYPKSPSSSCNTMPLFEPTAAGCISLAQDVPRTFVDARIHCLQQGSDLYTPEYDSQVDYLITYVGNPHKEMWVGIHKVSGSWVWLDGKPVPASRQGGFSNGDNEICARLSGSRFSDIDCTPPDIYAICVAKNFS